MSASADQVLDCDQDRADALHHGAASPSRRAAEVIEYRLSGGDRPEPRRASDKGLVCAKKRVQVLITFILRMALASSLHTAIVFIFPLLDN